MAMTDAAMSSVVRQQIEVCAGGGHAASGAAGWLGLAASPTFAAMALWTGLSSGPPALLCTAMHAASPWNGMALMYALMSASHAAPWWGMLSRRWRGRRSSSTR
jgi:hypothetical protein